MTETAIKLTPAEAEFVAEYFGTLETDFCSEDEDERGWEMKLTPDQMPRIEDSNLILSPVPEVNGELAYVIDRDAKAGLEYFEGKADMQRQKRLAGSLLRKLAAAGVKSII